MENFNNDFILSSSPFTGRPIRIAVLDTGLHIDDEDPLRFASERILDDLSRNYFRAESQLKNYVDTHGHGTHVVRILLTLAPDAEIVVVRITDGLSLERTMLQQVVDVRKIISIQWRKLRRACLTLYSPVGSRMGGGKDRRRRHHQPLLWPRRFS
jgi:hypothetical protein